MSLNTKITIWINTEYSGHFLLVLGSLTTTVVSTASFHDLEFRILVTSYFIVKIGLGLLPVIFMRRPNIISIIELILGQLRSVWKLNRFQISSEFSRDWNSLQNFPNFGILFWNIFRISHEWDLNLIISKINLQADQLLSLRKAFLNVNGDI